MANPPIHTPGKEIHGEQDTRYIHKTPTHTGNHIHIHANTQTQEIENKRIGEIANCEGCYDTAPKMRYFNAYKMRQRAKTPRKQHKANCSGTRKTVPQGGLGSNGCEFDPVVWSVSPHCAGVGYVA